MLFRIHDQCHVSEAAYHSIHSKPLSLKLLVRVTNHVSEVDHTALRSCIFKQAVPSAQVQLQHTTATSQIIAQCHCNIAQVGFGAMGVCQVQPVSRWQRHVWQSPLALELYPRLPHHHCDFPTPSHVGNAHVTTQAGTQIRHFRRYVCLLLDHVNGIRQLCGQLVLNVQQPASMYLSSSNHASRRVQLNSLHHHAQCSTQIILTVNNCNFSTRCCSPSVQQHLCALLSKSSARLQRCLM